MEEKVDLEHIRPDIYECLFMNASKVKIYKLKFKIWNLHRMIGLFVRHAWNTITDQYEFLQENQSQKLWKANKMLEVVAFATSLYFIV